MLSEIKCEKFIESPIKFKAGLNIVLGDDKSTNSIGKSSLLLIIDFVFGGNSYISINPGSISAIGHHEFVFKMKFGDNVYEFKRSTDEPEIINGTKNHIILETLTINQYTDFLKKAYQLEDLNMSFRSIVSLYSRIWGKGNDNVNKPLQSFIKEIESAAINNLIKLFEQFSKIEKSILSIKEAEDSKKVLNKMFNKDYVRKINKSEYKENIQRIESIEDSIKDIQNNLLQFTLNIEELSNEEVLNLKVEKNKILDAQALLKNKIKRIDLNLSSNGSIKSKHLKKLSEFFPNPNIEKIENIEKFHISISKILQKELKVSKKILEEENKIIQDEINIIDTKIAALLEGVQSPKFIVEKVYDMTINMNKLKELNKYYDKKETVMSNLKIFNTTLQDVINQILFEISQKINSNLFKLNTEIYSGAKKHPQIKLHRKKYTFDHQTNTGTGKSFLDLIIFDLSILVLTKLPFIIHDSFLFKNIEDESIDKILNKYSTFSKQVFIALDGTSKYQNQIIIDEAKVLVLGKNKLLFGKDWG